MLHTGAHACARTHARAHTLPADPHSQPPTEQSLSIWPPKPLKRPPSPPSFPLIPSPQVLMSSSTEATSQHTAYPFSWRSWNIGWFFLLLFLTLYLPLDSVPRSLTSGHSPSASFLLPPSPTPTFLSPRQFGLNGFHSWPLSWPHLSSCLNPVACVFSYDMWHEPTTSELIKSLTLSLYPLFSHQYWPLHHSLLKAQIYILIL